MQYQNFISKEQIDMEDNKISSNNFKDKKIVIFGEDTLLGKALIHVFQAENINLESPSKEKVDIFNVSSIEHYLEEIKPDYVINTVGYDLIQDAEKHPDEAFRLNKILPYRLSRLLKKKNIFFVNYSTDYVFDGKKDSPYTVEDKPNPTSIYGKSKLEGEKVILESGISNFLIIRTSLLFGPWKNNFVENILELIKKNKKITVINDKVMSPTYTLDLAKYSLLLLKKNAKGIFHLCNSGQASWCELASQVAKMIGSKCKIEPVKSDKRSYTLFPSYSVLDTTKFYKLTHIKPRSWVQALQEYLFVFHSSYFEE